MCSLTVGAGQAPAVWLVGLEEYQILSSTSLGGRVIYEVRPPAIVAPACPHCGRSAMHLHGVRRRRLGHAPQGFVPVDLNVRVQRYRCPQCHKTYTPAPPGLPRRARLSPALREFLGWLCGNLLAPISLVAHAFWLGWHTVKSCIEPAVPPELEQLRHLCIDEVYRGQRHKFKTILSDALTNLPLGVAEGRGRKPAEQLLNGLPVQVREQIETLATDFTLGHRSAGYHCLPNALVVADCFHLVRLGRLAVRQSPPQDQPAARQAFLELRALLKDRQLPVAGRLRDWLAQWANATGPLLAFQRTVTEWELEIEAYLATRRSNGPAEVLKVK